MKILDVTLLDPKVKHATIFQQFDDLLEGESFVIHNDHDPKPLYYQFSAEREKTFDWEYILKGPDFWEVKISKLNRGKNATTIGELVAADYRKADIFSKFGLDFSYGGKKTLIEACREKGIDDYEVAIALAEVGKQTGTELLHFNSWELDFLADYIVNVHHKYVKENAYMLFEYGEAIANRHGVKHPELTRITQLCEKIATNFKSLMQEEETTLFPYINKLAMAKREHHKIEAGIENMEKQLKRIENQHTAIGGFMDEIHQLSHAFTAPEDACSSYKVLYEKLDEFEKNLKQHIHLENNIIFPKSIQLEKELLK